MTKKHTERQRQIDRLTEVDNERQKGKKGRAEGTKGGGRKGKREGRRRERTALSTPVV